VGFAPRVEPPGKYLSSLFNQAILDGEIDSFTEVASSNGPFTYFHKGSLAYLGGEPPKNTQEALEVNKIDEGIELVT